jgi:hypothetical protein
MMERPETFTIHVDPSAPVAVTYTGEEAHLERATDLGELIGLFAKDMPAKVQLTFTKHDNPAVALGWEQKDKLVELARENECACWLIA